MFDNKLDDARIMEYPEQIKRVHEITSSMLEAAKLKKWEEVISLESNRHSVLVLMKNVPTHYQELNVLKDLKKLIELNDKLVKISTAEKIDCFNRFSKNRNTKKAFNAYLGA